MTIAIFFLISFIASTIGAISGIGGGVIIKPVLDAFGLISVSAISFLSGCTVLSMSVVSLIRGRGNGSGALNMKISTPLAIGAAVGGVVGKSIFDLMKRSMGGDTLIGLIQAVILLLITGGVFWYMQKKNSLVSWRFQNIAVCIFIGLLLGLISAFLGIGGGPINLAVLYLFFSMDAKTAARNSLYIIFFSQITSLLATFITGAIPEFPALMLVFMIIGGVGGGLLGSAVSKRLSGKGVEKVFSLLLFIIAGVCIYNILRFSFLL